MPYADERAGLAAIQALADSDEFDSKISALDCNLQARTRY